MVRGGRRSRHPGMLTKCSAQPHPATFSRTSSSTYATRPSTSRLVPSPRSGSWAGDHRPLERDQHVVERAHDDVVKNVNACDPCSYSSGMTLSRIPTTPATAARRRNPPPARSSRAGAKNWSQGLVRSSGSPQTRCVGLGRWTDTVSNVLPLSLDGTAHVRRAVAALVCAHLGALQFACEASARPLAPVARSTRSACSRAARPAASSASADRSNRPTT
jgi:hypothetical protein